MMGTALGRSLRLGEDCKNAAPDSESPVTSLTSEGLAAFSLGPVNDNHFISITVWELTFSASAKIRLKQCIKYTFKQQLSCWTCLQHFFQMFISLKRKKAIMSCDPCVVKLDLYCNFISQKNANVKKWTWPQTSLVGPDLLQWRFQFKSNAKHYMTLKIYIFILDKHC